MKKNPYLKIKNGTVAALVPGTIYFENGSAIRFEPDVPKDPLKCGPFVCSVCNNTGKVWVEYEQCADPECDGHEGWEDCENCNVRALKK